MVINLTKQDIYDILLGSVIAGCGAGIIRENIPSFIEKIYDTGRKVVLIDPSEVKDDDLIWSAITIGGEYNREIIEAIKDLPRIEDLWEEIAAKELSAFLGVEPDAYIVGHAGGTNGILSLLLAGLNEKPCIDGDTTGRPHPEWGQSTLDLLNIKLPSNLGVSVVTPFGDVALFKRNINPWLIRWMSIASGGLVGSVWNRGYWKILKRGVIPYTISLNLRIGSEVRRARDRGKDPVEAFIQASNGYKLFQGRIKKWEREHKGSFIWGFHIIEGTEEYNGHVLKNWFKNENLITWKDGKMYASIPDLICIVDAKTADGIFNWTKNIEDHIGKEVVVVGIKNSEIWRTPKGLELFGPKRYGFDVPYVPVENLVKR